jgi:hypothetical protein
MALLAMIRGAAQNNRVNFLRRAAGDVIGGGGQCWYLSVRRRPVVVGVFAPRDRPDGFRCYVVWLFCVLDATRSFDLSRQNPKQGQIRRPIVEPRRN